MVTLSQLRQFENVCIEKKWAKPEELDQWLQAHQIAVVEGYFICNKFQLAKSTKDVYDMLYIANTNGEQAATLILMWATGFTIFPYDLEKLFIDNMTKIMRDTYKVKLPSWFTILSGLN